MKRLYILLFFAVSFSLSAQQFILPGTQNNQEGNVQQNIPQAVIPIQAVPATADNLQLAISNRDYPVTPGDVYTLTFLMANETVSNTLLVESDYTINMTIFGKLNAEGMTFAQLKPVIEQKIADAYPRSLPSVTITTVGVFQVPIRGEIPESRYVTAWGLSRLSEILEGNLGDYSSVRDIEIISENGRSRKYDLLLALNQGILSQNPTIRPNDTIVINRIHRVVQIKGEVYKPGTYQLLDNEGIKDVEQFTGGFTPMANTNRIKVDRYSGDHPVSFSMSYQDYLKNFEFRNGDIITIPPITRTQAVVFVEGGITDRTNVPATGPAAGAAAVEEEYNRVVQPINDGETLYDILDSLRDSIAPFADLENGYVLRDGQPIPVNMQDLIYKFNMSEDLVLNAFDHIIIPVKRPVIYVTGAANFPGIFPYNPQEDYHYYVNLAGGFDTLRNNNGKVIIKAEDGSRRSPMGPIKPGDTVNVISNNFLYNFNQYFPAIATGLGMIITMITITNALQSGTTQ